MKASQDKQKSPAKEKSPIKEKEKQPSPSSSSVNKESPDEYFEGFRESSPGPWDPLLVHNICNVNGEFILPKQFPKYFPIMSTKRGPGFVADGYIFNCNNQKRNTKSKHFVCEFKSCPARLNTTGWTKVTKETGVHTCYPPTNLVERLLKWYIIQMLPVSKDMKATDLVVRATTHLSPTNLKTIPNNEQLIKYISDRRREMHPIAPSAKKLEDLVLDDSLKKLDDGTLFLLEDEDPEDEDQKRIICYATKENIKQLRASTTWLCDGTFATCPRLFYQLWMVHGQTELGVLPLAYFLLPGADEQVYTRAFKILQNALNDLPVEDNKTPPLPTRGNPEDKNKDEATLAAEKEARLRDLEPKTIIMDFELTQYYAFTKTFNG